MCAIIARKEKIMQRNDSDRDGWRVVESIKKWEPRLAEFEVFPT